MGLWWREGIWGYVEEGGKGREGYDGDVLLLL